MHSSTWQCTHTQLSRDATAEQLRSMFEIFGDIVDLGVMAPKREGAMGACFSCFHALRALSGTHVLVGGWVGGRVQLAQLAQASPPANALCASESPILVCLVLHRPMRTSSRSSLNRQQLSTRHPSLTVLYPRCCRSPCPGLLCCHLCRQAAHSSRTGHGRQQRLRSTAWTARSQCQACHMR